MPRRAAFMRMTAAEADTLTELTRFAYQTSFRAGVQRVQAVLDADPSYCTGDTAAIATRFLEVALQPLSFQAVFGGNLPALTARSAEDIDDAILLLKAKNLIV